VGPILSLLPRVYRFCSVIICWWRPARVNTTNTRARSRDVRLNTGTRMLSRHGSKWLLLFRPRHEKLYYYDKYVMRLYTYIGILFIVPQVYGAHVLLLLLLLPNRCLLGTYNNAHSGHRRRWSKELVKIRSATDKHLYIILNLSSLIDRRRYANIILSFIS